MLDTNVLSETRRSRANQDVVDFMRQMDPRRSFLSVLTLGELRRGAASLARRNPQGETALSYWIDGIEAQYAERILPVELPVARLWGALSTDRTRAVVNTLLAATAMHYGLTLVTRNVNDVDGLPVAVLNPWLPGCLASRGSTG